MAYLKWTSGEQAEQWIETKDQVTTIGRAPNSDIVLDSNGVSRLHTEIRKVGLEYYLVDLKPKSAMILNDERLLSRDDHLLKTGDRINLCEIDLLFSLTPPLEKS